MADEAMSDGEIRRSIERIETAARATNDRIASQAREMVPVELWQSEHRAVLDKVEHLSRDTTEGQARLEKALGREIRDLKALFEREVEDLRDEIKGLRDERARRSEITWQKATGLIAALAGAALVIVTLLSHGGGH
jgi:hypothetical protein